MLPRKYRVATKQVEEAFKKGRVVHTNSLFSCRFVSTNESPVFSVVVPKTIIKQAVKRNTIRRRWYGALHPYIQKPKKGIYVFLLKKEGTLLAGKLLEKELTFLSQC